VYWDNTSIIDFQKAYDSVILHNILIDSGMPMKVVRLITMCLNETYSKVHIGKKLSDAFPIQIGLKEEMLYHHSLSTLL